MEFAVIIKSAIQFAQTELMTRGGMVTSNHHLAAEAGAHILSQGGNAVDAALATSFAVGVVEPASSGIGGRGYMTIHDPARRSNIVIDGHERAPRAARPDMFDLESREAVPTTGWGAMVPVVDKANSIGHQAVAVPGVLAALGKAHQRYGTLPLKTILDPAISLAANGFVVSVQLATITSHNRAKLARFPDSAALFLPDGSPLAAGERLTQPDLARTLKAIAERGTEEIYTGPLARALVTEMERGGGILSAQDLADYEPRIWDKPQIGHYRGYQLLTLPEATGGVTILEIMNILEGYDLGALDPFCAEYLHLVLEALRISWVDRWAWVDDPDFARVPFAGLASKDFAAERRGLIALKSAQGEIRPGDPWPFEESDRPSSPRAGVVSRLDGDEDTTHFCVIDGDGMIVNMTQSIINEFGCGLIIPKTGVFLNSAMNNFNPLPGERGSIAPWRRSVNNASATMVLRPDGSPLLSMGGAGGTKGVSGAVQILVNLVDRGWTIQEAVAAPRVHGEGWDSLIDSRISPHVVNELRGMGHRLEVVDSLFAQPAFSRINAIMIDDAGLRSSGVDIFTDAAAAAID